MRSFKIIKNSSNNNNKLSKSTSLFMKDTERFKHKIRKNNPAYNKFNLGSKFIYEAKKYSFY